MIDWQEAIRIAGDEKTAKMLFAMFMQTLPQDHAAITFFFAAKDFIKLQQKLHYMHGALCYLALPQLKSIVMQLEVALKNNALTHLPHLMTAFNEEVATLLIAAKSAATERL